MHKMIKIIFWMELSAACWILLLYFLGGIGSVIVLGILALVAILPWQERTELPSMRIRSQRFRRRLGL